MPRQPPQKAAFARRLPTSPRTLLRRWRRCRRIWANDISSISRDVHKGLLEAEAARTALDSRAHALECNVTSSLESLKDATFGAENATAHTMTWRIYDWRKKLRKLLVSDEKCLASHPFALVSQWMTLDVMAAAVVPFSPSKDARLAPPLPSPGSAVPSPGACSIRLWCAPDTHLVFCISLGEGSSVVARRFEHFFKHEMDSADCESRVSFQTPDLCQFDQIWVQDTDTLTISVEVLEIRVAVPVNLPPPEIPSGETEPPENQAGSAEELIADARDKRPARMDAWLNKMRGDEMTYGRHSKSDALVLELFKRDLEVLRNRSVRRIEWRLEGCAQLLEKCEAGAAVESPLFCAAGLDKLQIHFYPRGRDGDVARSADLGLRSEAAQLCAIFVSCPLPAAVRGMLSVGSQSRAFDHRFGEVGDLGGIGRLCLLRNQIDHEDSVVLALDLSEVETDIPDTRTSLRLRTANARAQLGSATPQGSPGKSSLRMRRQDPLGTEEVVRCASMPTLNARRTMRSALRRRQSP